jgi:hypothetical protein
MACEDPLSGQYVSCDDAGVASVKIQARRIVNDHLGNNLKFLNCTWQLEVDPLGVRYIWFVPANLSMRMRGDLIERSAGTMSS